MNTKKYCSTVDEMKVKENDSQDPELVERNGDIFNQAYHRPISSIVTIAKLLQTIYYAFTHHIFT